MYGDLYQDCGWQFHPAEVIEELLNDDHCDAFLNCQAFDFDHGACDASANCHDPMYEKDCEGFCRSYDQIHQLLNNDTCDTNLVARIQLITAHATPQPTALITMRGRTARVKRCV